MNPAAKNKTKNKKKRSMNINTNKKILFFSRVTQEGKRGKTWILFLSLLGRRETFCEKAKRTRRVHRKKRVNQGGKRW